ncbi:translation initiation factor eIF2 beta subunit [Schizosaccharomyces osmophilus]|uniref:Translation initiation factor eIF2 beta subunit n=1 Tax=Schizosaccharomyces osmophilus TaxID=2545709 RepID=A0AAF0AX37_9SCHI|nr:translation initiation factor eIF2 beta subunit [Schizosaccharomyces osmophilus]WBW73908.1 translation initiation factor eIF2 beta subunit [Schizosaccharomyces osmophilus]
MSDKEPVIDQVGLNGTLPEKKKKTKKSVAFDDEVNSPDQRESSPADDSSDDKQEGDGEDAKGLTEPVAEGEVDELKDMFASMKKKKKSKKSSGDTEGEKDEEVINDNGELDFSSMKKKKKKKKTTDLSAFEKELEASSTGDGVDASKQTFDSENMGEHAWLKSDRDYYYPELLNRFFNLLRTNNPELAGEKRKYTIVPPSVHREGKKTIFANINDIAKRMHRSLDHVIQFLFAELGTSGSIDGSSRLIIKGRFQQKQMENVLRRYIVEYVTCKTCKSPDTILTKENRIFFMTCEACGSVRSVQAIKTGYQAQIGRRKHVG